MNSVPRGRPMAAEAWDKEYREGKWEYLHGLGQASRYGVIAAYTRHFGLDGRVLDIGCGEALLFPYLDDSIGKYIGFDASIVAVERARVPSDRGQVLCADASNYPLSELGEFDIIIVNEVLYHIPEPLQLIHHLRQRLEPSGVLIISMFKPQPDSHWFPIISSIWEGIDNIVGPQLAGTLVTDLGSTVAWRISVFAADA